MEGGSADWTSLPREVLRCIADRLGEPLDFIRFRAVCKDWREAMPRHAHARFVPWIVEKVEDNDDTGDVLFYSFVLETYHMIHVEALEGKRVAGYGASLLLGIDMEDELSAVLVNPLTGEGTELPRLPECFLGTLTYGFATDPLMTGEEDVFVLVYNWPSVEVSSNVAMCRRGDAAGWATFPSETFWMDMPSHRNHLLTHGPQQVLQHEQAVHVNDEIDWVPGMDAVHVIEHQGRVRLLTRQELIGDLPPARAPWTNFVLHDNMVDHDAGEPAVAWADAPELHDKILLQSEDCSCYVLSPSDFTGLCGNSLFESKNSVYFLNWKGGDEVNQEDGGDGDHDPTTCSYYLCKWDMVDQVSTVQKKIPGFWDRLKPGMWFMPTLAY